MLVQNRCPPWWAWHPPTRPGSRRHTVSRKTVTSHQILLQQSSILSYPGLLQIARGMWKHKYTSFQNLSDRALLSIPTNIYFKNSSISIFITADVFFKYKKSPCIDPYLIWNAVIVWTISKQQIWIENWHLNKNNVRGMWLKIKLRPKLPLEHRFE